ncbi:MAG TPA: CPBP family intramembrane glutamic endopeptidase [Symbiobacteriaceae bacterium]|nr:CPBP family intramembrane glutamic endopeptidase [Symbiobacteriaceae bacterium]
MTAVLPAAMAATVWVVAVRSQQPAMGILNLSLPTLASGLFFALVQGSTGEEAGWRGFLQPIMEQKAGGVIKGSLLVGLVWSFWHTPLWFATGLVGWTLAGYIATFIIGNLALAVIIGVCYHRSKNLVVPMWVHFVSNAIATPYAGDPMEGRVWLVLFYVLAAAGFVLWHESTSRKRLPLGA